MTLPAASFCRRPLPTTACRCRHACHWGNRPCQSGGKSPAEPGFLWQLEQPWQVPPHPRIGGGGYPVWLTGRAGPSHFSIIPRPPYHPKYDPIEYKICKVFEIKKLWLKKDEQWDESTQAGDFDCCYSDQNI